MSNENGDDELRRPTIENDAECECGTRTWVVKSGDWELRCVDCRTPYAQIRWKSSMSGLVYRTNCNSYE